jgi:hypothetical protein
MYDNYAALTHRKNTSILIHWHIKSASPCANAYLLGPFIDTKCCVTTVAIPVRLAVFEPFESHMLKALLFLGFSSLQGCCVLAWFSGER